MSSIRFDHHVASFPIGNGEIGILLSSYDMMTEGSMQAGAGRDVSLRREGKEQEAAKVLTRITPDVKNAEPHLYFYLRLLRFHQGQLTEEAVLPPPPSRPEDLEGELSFDTVTYGVGNWRVYHNNRAGAVGLFRNVVKGEAWNSWGFVGSELELLRGEKQQESVALPYH